MILTAFLDAKGRAFKLHAGLWYPVQDSSLRRLEAQARKAVYVGTINGGLLFHLTI